MATGVDAAGVAATGAAADARDRSFAPQAWQMMTPWASGVASMTTPHLGQGKDEGTLVSQYSAGDRRGKIVLETMPLQKPRRSPRPQKPTSAADGSRDLAVQLFGDRPEHRLALLRAAWTASVGPELARRTEVLAVDGKTLRVRVPDAQWQKVLHRMRRDILYRLSRTTGSLAPSAIGFSMGPVTTTTPPPRPIALPPAEIAIPESIQQAANVIEDPDIRRQFARAAARYLQMNERGRAS